MLHHFRFYSSKSSPFRMKCLGSYYCEINKFAYRKFQKGILRLETTKSFIHIVFQVQINCFCDLFGRFTLVCSFFHKIAEGPDSFCHHCTYHQNLRNNHIRLPAIRCDFEKNNYKYQMHFRLRELASPSFPPLYPTIDINDDILSQSLSCFAKYVKYKYISSYYVTCNVMNC